MNTITHLRRLLARPVGRAASSIGDGHVMSGKGAWVVAVCAIGLSITGSATAAKLITGQQIKNSSLTGRDVKNGSLAAADLSRSARAALKGDVGPAGASGAVGPNGEAGAPGLKGETGEKGEAGKSVVADGSRIEPGVADIELKPGDDFKTILSTKLTSPDSGLLLGSGAVEVAAADAEQGTAVVSLRIVHNGHAHFVPSTTSVTPGSRQTLVSSFHCDLMPGAQDVQLQARVTGAPVTVGGRTADIVSATQGQ